MSNFKSLVILGGNGNYKLTHGVMKVLNQQGIEYESSHIDVDLFPDGEPNDTLANPKLLKGSDVLLFQSMTSARLEGQFLDIADSALHQFGARSVTGILPFMRFRRQDHPSTKELARSARLVRSIAATGTSRVLLCNIHSQRTLEEFENNNIFARNVDVTPAFIPYLMPIVKDAREANREVFCFAPDEGAIASTVVLAKALGVKMVINFKERLPTGKVIVIDKPARLAELKEEYGSDFIFGSDVLPGATVIMRDDEVNTGGTANLTGWRLRRQLEAYEVFFVFTHAVCSPGWRRNFLDNSPFTAIFSGNTLEINHDKSTGGKIKRVDLAGVIAENLIEIIREIQQ